MQPADAPDDAPRDVAHDVPEQHDGASERSARPHSSTLLTVFLLLALGGVCIAFWIRDVRDSVRPPPVFNPTPIASFKLKDHLGADFDSSELLGKIWVANFIFSNCAAGCPPMTNQMRALQDRLLEREDWTKNVRLVSFSVDPQRDNPKKLGEFASRYGAQENLWRLLTGDDGQVVRLSAESFQLSASQGGADSVPTHSDRFTLVDRKGLVRGYYRLADSPKELDRLLGDLGAVLDEASER